MRRLGHHSSLAGVEVVDHTHGPDLAADMNLGQGSHSLPAKDTDFG